MSQNRQTTLHLVQGRRHGGGSELGDNLGSSFQDLRSGNAWFVTIPGHPGAGDIPESKVLEVLSVEGSGQVQAELHGVHHNVQVATISAQSSMFMLG